MDLENLLYFSSKLFQQHVQPVALPSIQLCYWVQAVYVTFGEKIDCWTKRPLCNSTAWSNANIVLKEIESGYHSDPPGFNLYCFALDRCSKVKTDQYGIELVLLSQTDLVANIHKSYSTTFHFACGFEMGDCMLAKRHHRHNIRTGASCIAGYSKFGYYSIWLIDQLQKLIEDAHRKVLYPS